MFVHYPLFTQNHPPFLYYKKGHIVRLLVNCGLSLLPFQVIYCETQILTDQKLTSSTFPCCVFVCPSKSVTSPLFSTLWCFRPYKPYISRKLMTPTIHWPTDHSPITHTDPQDPLNPPRTHLTWPFLHFKTFYAIQTKYLLKPHDTQYPLTHWPLTHHSHRPTKPTHLTKWPSESRIVVQRLV